MLLFGDQIVCLVFIFITAVAKVSVHSFLHD